MRALPVAVAVVLVGGVVGFGGAGCDARSSDPGVRADLQVTGARFVPGALPMSQAGPGVVALQLPDARVVAGEQNRPLLGQLEPAATALLLMLDGDRGYWIVGAGVPGTDAPTLPSVDVRLAYSRRLAAGPRRLLAVAVDAAGHAGAVTTLAIDIASPSLPTGPLVVHLEWSDGADLDLHVVDPDGVEIWARHPSGYRAPPPPALPDPTAAARAPQLDGDSNAGCLIDGRNQENVVWPSAPAPGHYLVRVDAASLCGLSYADWRLLELSSGSVAATVGGEALDSDTRGAHGEGAGRTALEFDVP